MDEQYWFNSFCTAFLVTPESINAENANRKPSPMPWVSYFVQCLRLDENLGRSLSCKWVDETSKILADELSALQELILAGEDQTALYQIAQLSSIAEKDGNIKPIHEKDVSALHYAVLTGRPSMVEALLRGGFEPNLNRNDIITGFTPLHIALFIQNPEMVLLLLKRGAKLDISDNYGATFIDYARLLDILPHPDERQCQSVLLYDPVAKAASSTQVPILESRFGITWCPRWRVTADYIEELMFSGFNVGEKDEQFRRKYLGAIEASSGDENVILAEISPTVGWGAYAARDIDTGEFIIRYGGCFERSKLVKDRAYSIQSGVDGIILNAKIYRNGAAFINHSLRPNAESQCFFHKGVENSAIFALRPIAKGEQILLNYSDSYFKKGSCQSTYEDFASDSREFPFFLPLSTSS